MSKEHFTIDGHLLINAWASLKSFKRKTKKLAAARTRIRIRRSISTVRSGALNTHESTTDSEARLARKGAGKEAKLSFAIRPDGESKRFARRPVDNSEPDRRAGRRSADARRSCWAPT